MTVLRIEHETWSRWYSWDPVEDASIRAAEAVTDEEIAEMAALADYLENRTEEEEAADFANSVPVELHVKPGAHAWVWRHGHLYPLAAADQL